MESGRAFVMLNVGGALCGFHIDSVTDIPDVGGRMWRMTYEKNGAELIWLEREDEVKTFVVAFKTLPSDDTGVAHILEHSVLAGSEKYPVKSPFDEMRKSSACVFMNAMTSRDATYYPFSTRNDKDFLNLEDVYLDAVFHPLSIKDPMSFKQEGWHYELSKDHSELSVNGVVFNEMKGVFALPERRAYREIVSALYPDIVYGHDSGGRPEKIPNLTYSSYRDFHKRFYHPSNARIFLDGKVKISEVLGKLDSFLSAYDKAEVQTDIAPQKPVVVKLRIPYESAQCNDKVIYVNGWSVGSAENPTYVHALDILTEYLCGSNESPLKKALLDARLCKDVSMGSVLYQEMPLYLILKDTSESKLKECRGMVRTVLEQLCEKGLDKQRLYALINRDEFSERELNTSRPKGLVYFSRTLRAWMYGYDPVPAMSLTPIYENLRQWVEERRFEEIIGNRILNNPHRAEIVFTPDAELALRRSGSEKERLASIRSAMSSDELEKVVEEVANLKTYQNRKDKVEEISRMPRLRSDELSKTGIPVTGVLTNVDGVTQIKTKTTADGIFYLTGVKREGRLEWPIPENVKWVKPRQIIAHTQGYLYWQTLGKVPDQEAEEEDERPKNEIHAEMLSKIIKASKKGILKTDLRDQAKELKGKKNKRLLTNAEIAEAIKTLMAYPETYGIVLERGDHNSQTFRPRKDEETEQPMLPETDE